VDSPYPLPSLSLFPPALPSPPPHNPGRAGSLFYFFQVFVSCDSFLSEMRGTYGAFPPDLFPSVRLTFPFFFSVVTLFLGCRPPFFFPERLLLLECFPTPFRPLFVFLGCPVLPDGRYFFVTALPALPGEWPSSDFLSSPSLELAFSVITFLTFPEQLPPPHLQPFPPSFPPSPPPQFFFFVGLSPVCHPPPFSQSRIVKGPNDGLLFSSRSPSLYSFSSTW